MRRTCGLLLALLGIAACSESSASDTRSKGLSTSNRVRTALDALARVSGKPRNGVANFGVPRTSLLADNLTGVKLLRHGENRSCGGIGSLDVYVVTGDAEALWQRMRQSGGDLETAETTTATRRIRLLTQSDEDYATEAALIQSSGNGALLAVGVCS